MELTSDSYWALLFVSFKLTSGLAFISIFIGDLDGLEFAEEEEPKLLEYKRECEGDSGCGAGILTGLGDLDFTLDMKSSWPEMWTFSGLEDEGLDVDDEVCFVELDLRDKVLRGYLGGNFGEGGIFSGLLPDDEDCFSLGFLTVTGDLQQTHLLLLELMLIHLSNANIHFLSFF